MNIFSYLLLTVVLVLLVNLFLEFIKDFFKTTPAMNKENSKKTSIFLWNRTRRFKFVPQIDSRDCGPAALASVAKHYGSDYSLSHLRELTKTDQQGTTALGIIEAAKSIGFETYSLDADMSLFNYDDLIYPFIVHVVKNGRLQHYYVVYGDEEDSLIIGDPDPSVKVVRMSKERFQHEWTGLAIFFSPRDDYQPQKDKRRGLTSFIPSFLKQKSLLIYIIMASLIITLVEIIGAFYLQVMLDEYIPSQKISTLGLVALGLIIIYVIQRIITFAKEYLLIVLGQRLTIDIILTYIKHIFTLPMSFFSTRRTGEITSRFTDANQIIDAMASTIFSIILDISTIVLVGGVLLIQNIFLFSLALVSIPIYIIIFFVFMKMFGYLNYEVMESSAMMSSSVIEDINGIETIKSLTSEEVSYQRIDKEFVIFLEKSFRLRKYGAIQTSIKTAAKLILNVIILWYGAKLVMSGKMSAGQMLTFNVLLGYFSNPLENIINLQTKLQSAQVANTRLNEVYLVKSEFENDGEFSEVAFLDGDISFEKMSYKYGYGRDTISGINLTIPKGSKVSIVGSSGSGKTTLAKLMVNFYEPNCGAVRINGYNLKVIDKTTLRQHISYLPQQAYIFSGTIMDNLILGAKEGTTHEDIIRACEIAEIRSDIEQMPLGYQTELSDSAGVSGGQKQRIALARALLTQAPVLILDEATSSLDVLTEKKIVNNLMAMTNKTIIFVAHRLSIAQRTDWIIVMDQGRIVEKGSHKELLANKGFYYKLFN
ncbi:peptide cleavage/export ABC transporter [Streptococcus ratti]|uniref:ABC transporter, ATP-binding protein n=1 Tax=Streptococcus ratti FA-1 = DSM 20564 TaxID=699248 RepID=A0ABP2R3J0_STRRT|nr:peptide cleavage/export ABC transporter [Streptococcus ratti]EJN94944.1 putative ABC transporter, ATP-binding protein [Streptococcus ratti FA-1 = DSM 20564]EMP69266.1 ABC transporter ATP-binding protein [Streptococcus ratti FA-1 = DSM 20564]QEY06965.1 peptide cleavage/export ABC transporter [Streptococcus ratti]VEI59386.1 ABC transporter ATP-binding protein [Streptococcus mutans]